MLYVHYVLYVIVLLHEVITFLHCSRSYKDSCYPRQSHNFDTQLDVEKPLMTKSMVTLAYTC